MRLSEQVGPKRKYHDDIEAGDIIHFDEWWGKENQWAEVIEVDQGMTTVHFRLRFEDDKMEKWNQEDKEWFRLKNLHDATLYARKSKGLE